MLHARGEYLLFADADGASEIQDLTLLEKEMEKILVHKGDKRLGVVVGSRADMEKESDVQVSQVNSTRRRSGRGITNMMLSSSLVAPLVSFSVDLGLSCVRHRTIQNTCQGHSGEWTTALHTASFHPID